MHLIDLLLFLFVWSLNMPTKEIIAKIWSDAEGNDFDKAHAVLKEYFRKKTTTHSLILSPQDRLIQLFIEKKDRNVKPIDSIDKLIIAAIHISSGPILSQFIDVIHEKINSAELAQLNSESLPTPHIESTYLAPF